RKVAMVVWCAQRTLRRGFQNDPHLVLALLGQLDLRGSILHRQRLSVDLRFCNSPHGAVRVLDGDRVDGGVVAEGDLVAGPGARVVRAEPGQARGMVGAVVRVVACRWMPRIDSMPARYIQPAEPVYQVQPPRPTWVGSA